MKINKRLRKAFTLVELVVVIAIIAILSTVSVVTYFGITNSAKKSVDDTLIAELNKCLQLDETINGKPNTPSEALEVVEENGFTVEKMTPTQDKKEIVWHQTTNKFELVDEITENTTDVTTWRFLSDYTDNHGYSVYLKEGNEATSLDIATGLDVGKNAKVEVVNYTNTENVSKYIVIRSNSSKTTINVDGYAGTSSTDGDKVYHYGDAEAVYVNSVGMKSYHEFGTLAGNPDDNGKQLYVKNGRVVVESISNVRKVYIQEGATSNGFKVETPTDTEVVIDAADKSVINKDNVSKSEGTIVPVEGAVAYSYQTKQSYSSLNDAIANGGKVKLLSNIDLGATSCVISNNVEIDFFGYTIFGKHAASNASTVIIKNAEVVFSDSSTGVKGGVVDRTNEGYVTNTVYVNPDNGRVSSLTINDGVRIENYSTLAASSSLYYNSKNVESKLIINDSKIYSTSGNGIKMTTSTSTSKSYAGYITINNCKVDSGNYALFFSGYWIKNKVNINDGEYITHGGKLDACINISPIRFSINGGSYNLWPLKYNSNLTDSVRAVVVDEDRVRMVNEAPVDYVAKTVFNGKETYTLTEDISKLVNVNENNNLEVKKNANIKVENYGVDLTDEHLTLSIDIASGATLTGAISLKSADIVKTGAGNINLAVSSSSSDYEILNRSTSYSSSRVKESANLIEVTLNDGTVTKYTQAAFENMNVSNRLSTKFTKIKLLKDWDWSNVSAMEISYADLTIDLNGHKLTGTKINLANKNNISFIKVSGVTLTIEDSVGTGVIQAKEDLYGFDVINNGKLVIKAGNFYGSTTIAQCEKGLITIEGGNFKVSAYTEGSSEQQYAYTLNCIDGNYKNGTANIVVKGGKFFEFDPSNNTAESDGTNFVEEGYESNLVPVDGFNYYVITQK